jgi:multisubunit Na+/H+ antiporter MnhG subunit
MKIARHELEDIMWYRFLKVLYKFSYIVTIISLLFAIIASAVLMFDGSESGMFEVVIVLLLFLIVTPFVFKLIARTFFYIITGEK